MGLAGLLKAGWRNLVTSSRMDRMGLLAMGRAAKSSNGMVNPFVSSLLMAFGCGCLLEMLAMFET